MQNQLSAQSLLSGDIKSSPALRSQISLRSSPSSLSEDGFVRNIENRLRLDNEEQEMRLLQAHQIQMQKTVSRDAEGLRRNDRVQAVNSSDNAPGGANEFIMIEKVGEQVLVEADQDEVEFNQITDEEFAKLRAGNHRYEDEGKIFHMAVIDYLQEYNWLKRCERFFVPYITGAEQSTISVAQPPFYGKRFYSFMKGNFFS